MPDTPPGAVAAATSEALPDEARLVFIGGAPRSGTTLIQRIIGAHSEVYSGPEFDFMPAIAALRSDMRSAIQTGRISTIVDAATLDVAISGMVRRMFNAKAAMEGRQVFSEKTPSNLLVFGPLLEMFPDARFVFVVRDPRDILASMQEVKRRHRSENIKPPTYLRSVRACCREINRYWKAGMAALESDPDRVLVVHYEDTVTQPESAARRLCSFLGLTYEPAMLRIEEKRFDVTENVASRVAWYRDEDLAKPISRPDSNRARKVLSRSELGVIARTISSLPITDRYDFTNEPVTLGAFWTLAKSALVERFWSTVQSSGRWVLRRVDGG